MWDRSTIIEKVKLSADKYGSNNPQQIKQLLFGCEKSKSRELFFGIFSFFYDPELQDNACERQHLAGYLLYKIKPECPLEIDGAIYAVPKYWDHSVEEIPWYLCSSFGVDAVRNFLEELLPSISDNNLKHTYETMLFWVKNYDEQNT